MEIRRPSNSRESLVMSSPSETGVPIQSQPSRAGRSRWCLHLIPGQEEAMKMISRVEEEEEGQKAKSNCGSKSQEERAGQKRDRGPLTMNRTPKPPKIRLNPFRNHRKSLPKDRAPHHSLSQSPRVLAHYSPLLSKSVSEVEMMKHKFRARYSPLEKTQSQPTLR